MSGLVSKSEGRVNNCSGYLGFLVVIAVVVVVFVAAAVVIVFAVVVSVRYTFLTWNIYSDIVIYDIYINHLEIGRIRFDT